MKLEKVKTNVGIEVNSISEEEYTQIEKENKELIKQYRWSDCCRVCDYSNTNDPTIQFRKFTNRTLYPCSKHDCLVNPDKICSDFKNE